VERGNKNNPLPEKLYASLGPNLVPKECKPESWCQTLTCPAPGAPSKCYPGGRRYYDQGVFHMLDGKCKMQVVDGQFLPGVQ